MLPTFNIPPIGPKMGKVWGTTQLVFAWNGVEAHSIRVKKGGYCSRHSHEHKWNRFVVMEGRLKVTIFYDDGKEDSTTIEAGGVSDVPPGVRHEFEALDDVLAMEQYWTMLDPGDIDRHGTEGGMR